MLQSMSKAIILIINGHTSDTSKCRFQCSAKKPEQGVIASPHQEL
jgi:hypothetical protein